ncbi:hypothetical protein KH172YL63_32270 [Bacillus sp. KH172YL63]|nr:hypothetical protein KH172YL63_32270 [Bacillus sp. KH172YL63]
MSVFLCLIEILAQKNGLTSENDMCWGFEDVGLGLHVFLEKHAHLIEAEGARLLRETRES